MKARALSFEDGIFGILMSSNTYSTHCLLVSLSTVAVNQSHGTLWASIEITNDDPRPFHPSHSSNYYRAECINSLSSLGPSKQHRMLQLGIA